MRGGNEGQPRTNRARVATAIGLGIAVGFAAEGCSPAAKADKPTKAPETFQPIPSLVLETPMPTLSPSFAVPSASPKPTPTMVIVMPTATASAEASAPLLPTVAPGTEKPSPVALNPQNDLLSAQKPSKPTEIKDLTSSADSIFGDSATIKNPNPRYASWWLSKSDIQNKLNIAENGDPKNDHGDPNSRLAERKAVLLQIMDLSYFMYAGTGDPRYLTFADEAIWYGEAQKLKGMDQDVQNEILTVITPAI